MHDDGARSHSIAMTDVANLEFDQIASPKFAVESQVKHGQFPDPMFDYNGNFVVAPGVGL